MATYESTIVHAQFEALDRRTARRVARLVVECRVSLALALQAVQEADRERAGAAATPRRAPGRLTRFLAHIGAR
jgi:hypothetical protein